MKRLIQGKGLNNPVEYDKIFLKRKENGVDAFDLKRWKKLLRYYRGGKLIDLGCLDSLIPSMAKELYPNEEIWAIDLAEESIREMKLKYQNIFYQVGDVYKTEFPKNYFSYAVAGELIEHLEKPEEFFKETFRILKSGGILALSTPWGETKAGEVDNQHHLWSFLPKDIYAMLNSYGEVWIKRLGSQYFPKYIYHFPVIIAFCKKN